jgi:hypothetical protein
MDRMEHDHLFSERLAQGIDHSDHVPEHAERRRHLLIAETGRSGTSVLVRYLTALGLETHLSKRQGDPQWDDAAQAGLEDLPISTISRDLPYVVKSPWSYQFVDEILADPHIGLDAVVIPMRDLVEATASRTIVQLQAVHQENDHVARFANTWEHWGSTPGGVVFSLHPLDQARLLAVGFHRLLERLVKADVPTILIAFPRFATDPDYLLGKLSPVLPVRVSSEKAREAHAATFSAANVRVGDELSREPEFPLFRNEVRGPSFGALDNIALKRSLDLLRNRLEEVETSRKELEHESGLLRDQVHHLSIRTAELEADRAAFAHERDTLLAHTKQLSICIAQAEADRVTLEHAATDMKRSTEAQAQRLAAAQTEICLTQYRAAEFERRLAAIETSTMWRATLPLRAACRHFPRLARVLRGSIKLGWRGISVLLPQRPGPPQHP